MTIYNKIRDDLGCQWPEFASKRAVIANTSDLDIGQAVCALHLIADGLVTNNSWLFGGESCCIVPVTSGPK